MDIKNSTKREQKLKAIIRRHIRMNTTRNTSSMTTNTKKVIHRFFQIGSI